MAAAKNDTPAAQASVGQNDASQVFITRTFDAPRALVFDAWTDPRRLVRWFAPDGCDVEFCEIDVRAGGTFHSCIHMPGGHACWCSGRYLEVIPPERIVYSMAIANEQGNLLTADEAGMDPAWPRETIVTVTLEEQGAKTKLTLQQTVSEALAKRTGAHPSWIQMLDRLAGELESNKDLKGQEA